MKNLKLVFTIGLLALVTSCSKSKDEVIAPTLPPVVKPDPVKTADVYVAGWKYNSALTQVAAFWKNGVETELTDGTFRADARSIYVSETGDIYVAGKDGEKSKLWKNGVATSLGDLYSMANSVFVSGTDVYIGGAIGRNAAVWKNGVGVKLVNGPGFSVVNSVFVSGTDVYAAGYDYPEGNRKSVATLWKNGVATRLTDGTKYAVAKAVFVSGNDVYVISDENINPELIEFPGYENSGSGLIFNSVIKIWKNGVTENLTDGTKQAVGNSLFVNGSDVYVSGYENDGTTFTGSLWKNKIVTSVASGLYKKTGPINANSVFVHKDDVYVIVNEGVKARLWKNMFTVKEINAEGGGATALSVFVK